MNFLLINFIISLLAIFVTTAFIGVLVLFKSGFDKTKKIFSFYSFGIALWSFFQALLLIARNSSDALTVTSIEMVPKFFIPSLFLHFVISFLNIKKRNMILVVVYVVSAMIALLSLSTNFIIKDVVPRFYINYWGAPGILFNFAFLFFIICIFYGLYKLYSAYRQSSGNRKNQIAYLLWPSILGYIGGGANFLFYYNINAPVITPFGNYFVVIYAISVAYAILKYQLMDISIVIKRTLFYSVSIAVISGILFGIGFLNSWFVEYIPGFKSWLIPLISGIVAFAIGNLFWNKSKEVDMLKYEFVTVAAHKLRTPLTEIKWAVDSLNDEIMSAEINKISVKKLISGIGSANSKLIELTEELLSVSKADAGVHKYNLETINLERVAREVVNGLQYQMKEKKIKFIYNAEKNLPKISADRLRISSVIQMLLENAINYTRDEIKITIDAYKNNVAFHIEDNGIGIPKSDQPYIFSKFYRSHEAYLTETEGTGISLFLAKSIIEKHNGKIGLRSGGKEKGSIFWFELPAIKST